MSGAVGAGGSGGPEPAGGAQSPAGGPYHQEILYTGGQSGGSDFHRHHWTHQGCQHLPGRPGHQAGYLCVEVH